MKETASIYFNKDQRKELHKFIDFVYDYNMSCHSGTWDDYIQMNIYNEDEGTIVEFEQGYDGQRFEWIDGDHYVAPAGNEFLSIDEDQTYQIPIPGDFIPGHAVVKGSDIMDLAIKASEKKVEE